jgi:hypothetical protein
MKKLMIILLFLIQVGFSFGQNQNGVSGKIVDSKTQEQLQSIIVSIQNTNFTRLTDNYGAFYFENLTIGNQLLHIKSDGYKDVLLKIDIVDGIILDLGILYLEEDITQEKQSALISLTENDLDDNNSGSENTTSLLQSSRDIFLQAAAFNFGAARFSVRGIDNKYSKVMINGVSMNRTYDGRPQYGNWGGLNDATRNQEFTNGSGPSDYVFGGIAGTQEINTRASIYRPGTRVSFLNTNTNYSFRTMATVASGMNKKGWAFVISGGRRWAQDGYFEGTDYSANSLLISIEKKLNDRNSFSFTGIYALNKRGKNSPNTAEQTSLAGLQYNSYWGLQEGKKRNSRVKKVEEPLFIFTHYWKINPKTTLNTTVSYQIGQIGNSRIDYTKSDNPDPTYYRKLPSYFSNLFYYGNFIGNSPENSTKAEETKTTFIENRQLNWKNIYKINNENLVNGSRFVLYEDRNDEKSSTLNSNLTTQLSDNIIMSAGANYLSSKTKNFKNMLDLLGGNTFIDRSAFGRGDQQQSDLNNPNRQIVVGEHYGYNYNINATRLDAFTQFKFIYKKIDFYLAQTFSNSSYQREGLYKNGYYPSDSFGKSKKVSLDNFGFKGGVTFKLNGRNFIDLNGIYMTKAPNTKDVFPNSRISNAVIPEVSNENIKSFDGSYIIKTPRFKGRLTGYFSEIMNATDISFYYADAIGSEGAFVSEVITGINKKNKGIELGLEYQITSTLKITGVAAYGEYTFSSDPEVNLTNDASATIINLGKAKLTGYKQAGMPQQAYSFGIEYRDPKFWWIGTNANYLAESFIDVSGIKRTSNYYDYNIETNYKPIDQNLANEYLKQEKFNPFFLFNIVGGKSWKMRSTSIGLFATVNNILNSTYKTGGFEQSRNSNYTADYEDRQANGSVFGSKYFYGYGRTYMVNLYLSF